MNRKQLFILAAAIFVFSVTGSQARTETPEEVVKILAVLKAEKCKITRDSMGEKKLFVEGNKFVVEAACADGNSTHSISTRTSKFSVKRFIKTEVKKADLQLAQ